MAQDEDPLVTILASRLIGNGLQGLPAAPISTSGPVSLLDRLTAMRAINQLPEDIQRDMPPVVLVQKDPKPRLTRDTEAYVTWPAPRSIFVNAFTPNYAQAVAGNGDALTRLTSDLAHERYHITHGQDEAPAYDEQIRVLQLLGAPRGLIADVQRSKDWTERQRQLNAHRTDK